MEKEISEIDEQEYYQQIDDSKWKFIESLKALLEEQCVEFRLLGGEIDFLGDGWRLTPHQLFEDMMEISEVFPIIIPTKF
jgi:hypothetical protein